MVNVATVALFGYDKYQATRMLPESSERTLDWGGGASPNASLRWRRLHLGADGYVLEGTFWGVA